MPLEELMEELHDVATHQKTQQGLKRRSIGLRLCTKIRVATHQKTQQGLKLLYCFLFNDRGVVATHQKTQQGLKPGLRAGSWMFGSFCRRNASENPAGIETYRKAR